MCHVQDTGVDTSYDDRFTRLGAIDVQGALQHLRELGAPKRNVEVLVAGFSASNAP